MKPLTAKYVPFSAVADPIVTDMLVESEPDWSWGTNDITLVNRDGMLEALDEILDLPLSEEDTQLVKNAIDEVTALDENTYIDLEG